MWVFTHDDDEDDEDDDDDDDEWKKAVVKTSSLRNGWIFWTIHNPLHIEHLELVT